jgi:hypothetical protein
MSTLLQAAIVCVVVATASSYATVKLMPAAWRRALAARAASWASQVGLSDATARRVEAKLSSGGACGSCDSCKACAKPAGQDVAIVSRTIPLRRIG